MEFDLDLLRKQVEADPYQTTRELTVSLGVNQTAVVCGLKSIDGVRKLGRWVPHALTQYDVDRHADMALSLLMLKRIHTWLEHLVTSGDEKWIIYPNSIIFILFAGMPNGLTKALRGVNLEERQARLKNLAKLYFGNTTSTIRQNNNVASAVIDVDVKEFVTGSINDPSIEEINRKEGVSEFLFQGDINLTDEQLDWIERNIDIRKNTRSKRQVDSGARLWSNNRVFYFFDISIGTRPVYQ
ncbi:hypothetical protein RB195_002033 [Necator americanus]|uniref:Uncharacterized protein n=1 Tax=Necator americanus TaxID=51031 RepID=A0ABR1DH33_NECAM